MCVFKYASLDTDYVLYICNELNLYLIFDISYIVISVALNHVTTSLL